MEMRQSNIELLRLVSMLMVVLVHCNFLSLSVPTINEINSDILSAWSRYFFEALTIICVNEFILISGYFTIKPSMKGISNFLFMCIFYSFGFLILYCILKNEFSLRDLYKSLFLGSDYWFVKSYLALYLISPVLNVFLKSITRKQLLYFIIIFYIYQTYFNLFQDSTGFIRSGYSVWSFIGLYFIGYYIKQYGMYVVKLSNRKLFLCYIVLSGVISIFAILGKLYLGNEMLFYAYCNPLVVLSSICFFILFSKINLQNKFINSIAVSVFAVYLIHINVFLKSYFISFVRMLYQKTDGIICIIFILFFGIGLFAFCILIDRIRIWIWNRFVFKRLVKYISK